MGVELKWVGAANSHFYVSGQSGMGKSCFLKHCIAQLPQQGVRCVVFDYTGDLNRFPVGGSTVDSNSNERWDVRAHVGIDPFRSLLIQEGCPEYPYDTAARVSEMILSTYSMRGNLQQVCLRDVLTKYIQDGAKGGLSGVIERIQRDPELSRKMVPTLLRLQDLKNLLPNIKRDFHWELAQPGITVLGFDTLPNVAAQSIMTQFILADLWSEKLSHSQTGCPVIVVLDECQRFRFTDNSIFTRILREGRKYHISGWFASQWINDKKTVEALNQASLQAYFFPGNEQVNALAKRLAHGADGLDVYRRLIQGLGIGEFLYIDSFGYPIVNCVPTLAEV